MSGFRSFSEFYPYYLSEHKDPVCRRLHYIGSTLVLAISGHFGCHRFMGLLVADVSWQVMVLPG